MGRWRATPLVLVAGLLLTSCQQRRGEPSKESDGPAAAAKGVEFGGHWYRAFDNKVSWQQARERCRKLGGYLCCIDSKEEQEFIAKLANGRYLYLGGTDEEEEGDWKWVDGAPFGYTCWMSGQPNNYGGDENYLATYDEGEWVDVAAEGDGFWMPTGFICEWDGKKKQPESNAKPK